MSSSVIGRGVRLVRRPRIRVGELGRNGQAGLRSRLAASAIECVARRRARAGSTSRKTTRMTDVHRTIPRLETSVASRSPWDPAGHRSRRSRAHSPRHARGGPAQTSSPCDGRDRPDSPQERAEPGWAATQASSFSSDLDRRPSAQLHLRVARRVDCASALPVTLTPSRRSRAGDVDRSLELRATAAGQLDVDRGCREGFQVGGRAAGHVRVTVLHYRTRSARSRR